MAGRLQADFGVRIILYKMLYSLYGNQIRKMLQNQTSKMALDFSNNGQSVRTILPSIVLGLSCNQPGLRFDHKIDVKYLDLIKWWTNSKLVLEGSASWAW